MPDASVNYDEALVPAYRLPDLLGGASAAAWPARREALLELFRAAVYGRAPSGGWELRAERTRAAAVVWNGLAERSEIAATLRGPCGERRFTILLHLPRAARGPVPLHLGLNFCGNHTVVCDPWPSVPSAWMPPREEWGFAGGPGRAADRGLSAARWPIAWLCAEGFAVATVAYGELEPDRPGAWAEGLRGAFHAADPALDPAAWGAIGAWAFGLSRALDAVLACEPRIDPARVGAIGHSRLGKTALWAAAQDERFAWAMSNDSGCQGAALARRRFGERQARMNAVFPHWCCHGSRRFDDREDELPVDQHMLLALLAPRILHVASAAADLWADPRGEFLSCVHADPAWALLGARGLGAGADAMPAPGGAIGVRLRYHIRPGGHDLAEADWWRLVETLRLCAVGTASAS